MTTTFRTIAVHSPAPAHVETFLAFMRRVERAAQGAPGLVSISSHRDTLGDRLVAIAEWESPEAFQAAAPRIIALSSERDPAWTVAEDLILAVVPAG